ncbi:MAG: hypothetical protein ACR2OL_17265 [Anderseniella sp.]
MRKLFISLIIPFCTYAVDANAATEATCDIKNHTDRNPECWDTYDTIQDMGDVGHHLVHNAECREIIDATIQTGGTKKSPRQMMLNISFVTYSSGYAAGASKPADLVQVEMLTFCQKNPCSKLREF